METNLEKWNALISKLDEKTNAFLKEATKDMEIPKKYYVVYPNGDLEKRDVIKLYYNHDWHYYYKKVEPTKKELDELNKYYEEVYFSKEYIYIEVGYERSEGDLSFRLDNLIKVLNEDNYYFSYEKAKAEGDKIKAFYKQQEEFVRLNEQEGGFDYEAHGYKYLGFEEDWTYGDLDEDEELCSKTGKPMHSYGYSKTENPEFKKCREAKHKLLRYTESSKSTNNIRCCPICKIYWRFDSRDK